MLSGWTAPSRDSSKTEGGKAPRGSGQIRSELRMSSKLKLSRILPLKGQNPPGALCLPLPKSYHLSGERPSGYHSLLLRRKMSAVSPSPGRLSTGICLHCAFMKGARFDICLRKHVVAATGPSPFKVEDNQRPKRTMSGVAKTSA